MTNINGKSVINVIIVASTAILPTVLRRIYLTISDLKSHKNSLVNWLGYVLSQNT